jgi:hypothetical protein
MGRTRGHPCGTREAKHPIGRLVSSGLLDATTDSGVIKYWFAVAAPQANLGVRTDKLVVIDVDPRHGGDESLKALERQHGELSHTWRALTGGGGEHIIYAAPEEGEITNVNAGQTADPPLGRGIDIRARGGYIVGVGSRHICGRTYHWSVDHHPAETPLASPPEWLVEKLTARTSSNNTSTPEPITSDIWARLTGQPVTEYRDAAAASIAGHLFRHSCDYQLVRGLMHAWNSAWVKPPLGYRELDRIIDRICTRETERMERELAS